MQPRTKSKQSSPDASEAHLVTAEVSGNDVPIAYFDGMTNLAFGPFVSRVTFGVQELGGPKPTIKSQLTIVMPTASLHHLANQITKTLENPEHRKQLEKAFTNYQQTFPASTTKLL